MTEPTLTPNEATVLKVVRRQCRQGDPVATARVRMGSRPISYDNVDRALRGLVWLGLIHKPSRGFYLPSPEQTDADG